MRKIEEIPGMYSWREECLGIAIEIALVLIKNGYPEGEVVILLKNLYWGAASGFGM